MVISGAAEAYPDKVNRLVYLDAFIPEDGQCALDLLPPDIGAYFRKVAGEARDFVRARLCDFSLRCFEEPVRLGENRKSKIAAIFVSCVAAGYPARPFFEPFAEKARASGWQVYELDTGHDCHVESPGEVANVLLSGSASP